MLVLGQCAPHASEDAVAGPWQVWRRGAAGVVGLQGAEDEFRRFELREVCEEEGAPGRDADAGWIRCSC